MIHPDFFKIAKAKFKIIDFIETHDMGLYMYVTNEDRITKRKVSDAFVNKEFQEALKHDPSLMIEEHVSKPKSGFFSWKDEEPHYSVYHEEPTHDGSPYQARLQASGSGSKAVVVAYLHGIINGATVQQNT